MTTAAPNGIGFRCEAFRQAPGDVVTLGEHEAVVVDVAGPDEIVVDDPLWPGPLRIDVI